MKQRLGLWIRIGAILFLLGTALLSPIVAGTEAPASPEMDKTQLLEGGQAPYRIIGQAQPNPPQRFVYFHLDHLGSPRLILDETGATVSQHHYLAFGEELPAPASPDPTMNRRAFTGHERDAESGLDYMMARYYSSGLGRFMTADPGDDTDPGNPQSWNKYSYVRNNPLNALDPDGQESFECARPIRNKVAQALGAVHMFTVSGAPALGVSSSETKISSFGKTDSGAMGKVTETTANSTSAGVAQTDALAWESAGLPGSTTVCSAIPASDEAVVASASSVMETSNYTVLGGGTFGLNSNSAGQAVSEDAAQACLQPPGGWAPGAQSSGDVNFDKNKDGKSDPKPTAPPQQPKRTPGSRNINDR